MKATHTPGPWKAGGFENIVVNSADGFTIVACPCGSPDAAIAEIKANAALISAAPELLSALAELLALGESDHHHGCTCDECKAFAAARAAIAKAKGGVQ